MVARLGQGLLLHDPFLLAEEVVLGEVFMKVELGEGKGVHTAFGKLVRNSGESSFIIMPYL